MRLSHKPRLIAALLTLLSVLFMQLAVAAYACPSLQNGPLFGPAAMLMNGSAQQHSTGCKDAEKASSALCHAHCHPDSQSLDKAALNVSPFIASALKLVVSFDDGVPHPLSSPAVKPSLARTTSPPLIIQNCCFRI